MKTYNLTPVKIEVAGTQINVIKLGEKGRGRVEKLIKCDPSTADLFKAIKI